MCNVPSVHPRPDSILELCRTFPIGKYRVKYQYPPPFPRPTPPKMLELALHSILTEHVDYLMLCEIHQLLVAIQ